MSAGDSNRARSGNGTISAIRDLFRENAKHAGGFVYLNLATVLQVLPLNLIVFPYLSRRMDTGDFGEFILLITVVNFLTTVIAPPMVMTLYNRYGKVDEGERPRFFGVLLVGMSILLAAALVINFFGYDSISVYWGLGFGKLGFFYLLCYMFFCGVDSLLSSRLQIGLKFKTCFHIKIVHFLVSLLVIPAYVYFPGGWHAALILAPAASCLISLLVLVRERGVEFGTGPGGVEYAPLAKDYAFYLLTTIGAQLMIYGDRFIIPSFGISKEEIAYYTVAIQASSLVFFPIERISDFMMPLIARLSAFDQVSVRQAKTALLLLLCSLAYVFSFGFIGGAVYFMLYAPVFYASGWKYFVVILSGMSLFAFYVFARPFLVNLLPSRSLTLPFMAAVIVQFLVTVVLMRTGGDAMYAAVGKIAAYATLFGFSLYMCQIKLFRIAYKGGGAA